LQDERLRISARRFVPPSFNDIRRILNTAQVLAIAKTLQLITFDGDVTLYEDGHNLELQSPIVALLVRLLECGLHVAIVTAAGYTVR
jgi:IMP and pyridine-specific 5'-nucleotidase